MENKLYEDLMAQCNIETVLSRAQEQKLRLLNSKISEVLENMNMSLVGNRYPNNIVTLEVSEEIDSMAMRKDPNHADKYVKELLARKLAQKMIEEDLITIYHDIDFSYDTEKFLAKVKFVQE